MNAVRTALAVCAAILLAFSAAAQPGCSPPATNTSCATATALTVGGSCVNGTTCSGGTQGTSSCLYAGSQCTWYRFTATAANMFVNIDVTATSGCHISSNVYQSTGPCTGLTQISCLSGAPLDDTHILTGLTIGGTYYVQVCYAPGMFCGNAGSAQFCIQTAVPPPPCNTCSTPCGAAQGFSSNPTVAQVTSSCTTVPYIPPLQPGSANTFCNTFTATNSTVSFNVIITSDCGMTGNVTNFSWTLYNSPSCGGTIQTGTLSNLTFTGLTVGNSYVFCYTYNVPNTCSHFQHCPYFVGATTPLPVTWLGLDAYATEERQVVLDWATGTELNNDHFTIERSRDARNFEDIARVSGAGNSIAPIHYQFTDARPYPGLSYYRIRQTDLDGRTDHSNTVPVLLRGYISQAMIVPNPAQGDASLVIQASEEAQVDVRAFDLYGRLVLYHSYTVSPGPNTIVLATASLAQGVYTVLIGSLEDRQVVRFVKDQ